MLSMRTFKIKRLAKPTSEDPGSKKRTYQNTGKTLTGFKGTANAEFTAIVDGEFGKTFQISSDDFDSVIKIGDRVQDIESGEVLDVKGVFKNDDGPGRGINVIAVLPIDQ